MSAGGALEAPSLLPGKFRGNSPLQIRDLRAASGRVAFQGLRGKSLVFMDFCEKRSRLPSIKEEGCFLGIYMAGCRRPPCPVQTIRLFFFSSNTAKINPLTKSTQASRSGGAGRRSRGLGSVGSKLSLSYLFFFVLFPQIRKSV